MAPFRLINKVTRLKRRYAPTSRLQQAMMASRPLALWSPTRRTAICLASLSVLATYLVRRWRGRRIKIHRSHSKFVMETQATSLVVCDDGTILKLNNFKMVEWLGSGSFGEVHRAVNERGESVAIKRIDTAKLKGPSMWKRGPKGPHAQHNDALSKIHREIAVMKKIDHPNIVKLYEVVCDPQGDHIFLVMELLQGGDVMHPSNLDGRTCLSEAEARFVMQDVLSGLHHLHMHGIVHRDIKPENLVYCEPPVRRWQRVLQHILRRQSRRTVKIIDLGVAQLCNQVDADRVHKSLSHDDSMLKSDGTPGFFAPEMCRSGCYHGMAADIWALGVTLNILVSGKMPFTADNMPDMFEQIRNAEPTIPSDVSAPLDTFLRAMLRKRPDERPTCSKLLRHGWLVDAHAELLATDDILHDVHDEEVRTAISHMETSAITVMRAAKSFKKLSQAKRK